jgi:hypothetical protein
MSANTKRIIFVLAFLLFIFSALGGAIADRLFVIKPLDAFIPRNGSKNSSPQALHEVVREESVVIDVAEKASKSVVTVSITTTQQPVPQFFIDPFGGFSMPSNQAPKLLR